MPKQLDKEIKYYLKNITSFSTEKKITSCFW